jgi:hypothetical protein
MGMMRMHSMFPSMGTAPRAMKIAGDRPTVDTVKARAKRRAMQLVGIEDRVISMDPGEVSTTAMPSRMGYDDTIIEAEIPTEYGVDDSWILLDETAQGMGFIPLILGALSAVGGLIGGSQQKKAAEAQAKAQKKAASAAQKVATIQANAQIEAARLAAEGEAAKGKGLPMWAWAAIIGGGVLLLGGGALVATRKNPGKRRR